MPGKGMLELLKFEKRYEEIIAYAIDIKVKGKKLAFWGAGKKGTAFVERIDSKGALLE